MCLSPALFCSVMITRDSRPRTSDTIARPGVHLQRPPRDHPDHQQLQSQPGLGTGCWAHHVVLGVPAGNHADYLWLVIHVPHVFACNLSLSHLYYFFIHSALHKASAQYVFMIQVRNSGLVTMLLLKFDNRN